MHQRTDGTIKAGQKGIRAIFPYTIRGLFFLILACGLFVTGILRADLASLFWGCGFLSITLYSLVGNLVFVRIMRGYLEAHPSSVDVFISKEGVFPGEEATGELTASLPRFFVPGFGARFCSSLSFDSRKPLLVCRTLYPGKYKSGFTLLPGHRGIYRCNRFAVSIEDFLGFTEYHLSIPAEEYVKVYPSLLNKDAFLLRIQSEESTDTLKRKRVSDELLEVKKYYPGDDIRRINWKIFAHTHELFVRKGEETPPPEVKLLFLLDTALSPFLPESIRADYLDSLIASCATLLCISLDSGNPCIFTVPGLGAPRVFEKKGRNDLLTFLAGLEWQDKGGRIELPYKRNLHVVVLSSPGSPAVIEIIKAVRERNWGVSVLLKNFVFPGRPRQPFDLLRLFMLADRAQDNGSPSPWEAINFKQALYADIARLRQEPWRISDVREI